MPRTGTNASRSTKIQPKNRKLVTGMRTLFAASIAKTRTSNGHTIASLGKQLGMSPGTVRQAEAGLGSLETQVLVLLGQGKTGREIARMVSRASA